MPDRVNLRKLFTLPPSSKTWQITILSIFSLGGTFYGGWKIFLRLSHLYNYYVKRLKKEQVLKSLFLAVSAPKNESIFESWTNKNCVLNIELFLCADMTKKILFKLGSSVENYGDWRLWMCVRFKLIARYPKKEQRCFVTKSPPVTI